MSKYIIGIVIGLVLGISGVALANRLQPDIDGAGKEGWIEIGEWRNVKRFYDKDNNLVCWLYTSDIGYGSHGGISCVKVGGNKE